MDTLPTSGPDSSGRPYVPFSTALDAIALDEKAPATPEAEPVGERFIGLYSWWQTTGETPTTFVVVGKVTPETGWKTKVIELVLQGDSNRHRRLVDEFWQAVDQGKITNITYR